MKLDKGFYFLLVIINNIAAFLLIGISFLNGPPSLTEEEAAKRGGMFLISPIYRDTIFIVILSLFFSAITYYFSYIFRKELNIAKKRLLQIFFGQMILFIGSYALIWLYLIVRFDS